MKLHGNKRGNWRQNDLWVITKGTFADIDLSQIFESPKRVSVKEYLISDLGRYLLNPNAIEIEKKLIGCEIYYHQPGSFGIEKKFGTLFPKNSKKNQKTLKIPPETILTDREILVPSLKDRKLESHFEKIDQLLMPYDSISTRLEQLKIDDISDVIGICEDIDGIRTSLNLQGVIENKISYIRSNILKNVRVILEKPHLAGGLFEMRGYDFSSYDPNNSYRLIKFVQNGTTKICVLDKNRKVDYWIENEGLVHCMHLLEQAISGNPKFSESVNLCIKGQAKPFKLLLNKQLEINYSENYLPEVYKKAFEMYNVGSTEKAAIINSLKNLQFGISFHYLPENETSTEGMFTSISVMHNLRALEPIRRDLPDLYSEINKRASSTEIGKYYVLDSIRGSNNA